MAWPNGTHRPPLPAATRQRILNRDGHQCVAIMRDTGQRCPTTTGLEIDHRIPVYLGGTDDDTNLRALCHWHHTQKTQQESTAAKTAKRTTPKHPGLR